MALSELAAVEAAYQVLHPLDAAARRRALQWLSDALSADGPLPESATATARSAGPDGGDRGPDRVPAAASAPTRTARRRAGAEPVADASAARPRRVRAAGPAAAPVESRERVYRRMPPADEVMAAYRQVGSVSGLADYFGVPRYTVQGWARQLRKQGHAIGRTN